MATITIDFNEFMFILGKAKNFCQHCQLSTHISCDKCIITKYKYN